jgi:Transposase zinc-binding domain
MTRPPLEVADLVRTAGTAFIERNRQWLRWTHIEVLLAIARCRTAALGGHIDACTRCGYRAAISYNSCRNRHCPKCQTGARERWIQARRRELLPTPYVHIVFTLPQQLAALALQNKKVIYGLLLRAQCGNFTGSGSQPRPSWCRDRLLQRAAHLESGIRSSRLIPTSTVSFPPAGSRSLAPVGFDPILDSFSRSRCSGEPFAASSSTVSSRPFNLASFTSPEIWPALRTPRSSLPGCGPCSEKTGWSTPNHPLAAPSTCCTTWAAIPIA